jgi:hypothetical protein
MIGAGSDQGIDRLDHPQEQVSSSCRDKLSPVVIRGDVQRTLQLYGKLVGTPTASGAVAGATGARANADTMQSTLTSDRMIVPSSQA